MALLRHVYRNRPEPELAPAILLRESYRDGGKIKKRTIANLSHWPTEIVEGLRTLLKGGTARRPVRRRLWSSAPCRTGMWRPCSARCATSVLIVCSGLLATAAATSSSR